MNRVNSNKLIDSFVNNVVFSDIYSLDCLLNVLDQYVSPFKVDTLIIHTNGSTLYCSNDLIFDVFHSDISKFFSAETSVLSFPRDIIFENDSNRNCLLASIPLFINETYLANWYVRESESNTLNVSGIAPEFIDKWLRKSLALFFDYIKNDVQHKLESIDLKQKNERLLKLLGSRIRKEEYQYRFLKSVDEAVILVQDGQLKYFNPIICKMLGYSREELINKNFIELVDASDLDLIFCSIPRIIECEEYSRRTTIRLIRKDRNLVLVEIQRIQSVWNQMSCLYFFLTNISVQKRCFENQKPINLFCLTILENTRDGIILLDVREKVLFKSSSACEILGILKEEVVDLRSMLKIHPDDIELMYSNLALVIENPAKHPIIKLRIEKQPNQILWLECRFINLLRNPNINAIVFNFKDITELVKLKNLAEDAFEFQNALLDAIPIPVFYKDLNCKYIGANKCFEKQLGVSNEQIFGKTVFDILPTDVAEITNKSDLELLKHDVEMTYELAFPFADGSMRDSFVNKAIFKNSKGQTAGIIGVIQDISEKNRLINSIKRTTRLYSLLSQVNQTILRAQSVNELYKNVCDVAISFGEFRLAWIGIINENEVLIPIAYAGFEDGYLDTVRIEMHDIQRGNGIAGTAVKSGQIITSPDIEFDTKMEPWREDALKRGYHSAASVPLMCKGKVISVFTLYSSEKGFFTDDEVALLKEISDDISFALDAMAVEAARIEAEEELRINITRLEFAMQVSNLAWWLMDLDTGFVTFERKKAEMLGYHSDQFHHFSDFMKLIHPDDYEMVMENMREHIQGVTDRYEVEYRILANNGDYKWYYDIGSVISRKEDGRPWQVSGIVRDISARKRDEIALFQKEELLRESQIIAGLGGFEVDFTTKQWKGTEVLDRLMGYKRSTTHSIDELIAIVYEEDKQRMYDYFLKEVFGARKKFDAVYRIIRVNDNQIRWIHGLGVVKFDNNGQMVKMRGTIQDITNQKIIEDELLEREQRYSAIFNDNSAVMLILDPRTANIIDANEAACNFYGYSKADLLSKNISEISITPRNTILNNLNNSFSKKVNHFYFQHRLGSGEIRHVEVYSGPIKIKNSDLIYSIIHDITDRVVAETKMIKTNALLQSILESSPDVIIGAFDTSFRYIAFNKKFKEVMKANMGVDIELGMNHYSILKAFSSGADEYKKVYDRVLSGESITEIEESISEGKDPITWLKYWSPIKSELGTITGLTTFVINVTEQRKAEAIKEQNKELTVANADKDRFISILAHDLRTPFNSILGYLQLLSANLKNYSVEEIEFQINTITLSAKQAYTLLEDVLLWARTQAGKLSFEPTKCSLSQVVSEVIEEFRGNASKKGIVIRSEEPTHELFALADINMLKTILRNFLSNAIKFTGSGGLISVNAKILVDQIVISVLDTGVGMSEDKVHSLFDLKQNQSTLGTEKEKGSGLGLLLCKEFVEKHGGTLCVDSTLGKGTNFSFTMPIYQNIEVKIDKECDELLVQNVNTYNLVALIVEKEDSLFNETQKLLAPYCKEMLYSYTGSEAIEKCLLDHKIDLIFIDIQLPDISGYEVAKRIRETNPNVIIISQSAFEVSGVSEKSLNAGCNEYFPKPYKQAQFAPIIAKYFR